jgi:hypothetical protein
MRQQYLPPTGYLPSPYESPVRQLSWMDAPVVSSLDATHHRHSLSNGAPLSALHAEMHAYQKALEANDARTNQSSRSGPHDAGTEINDPPPVYTN